MALEEPKGNDESALPQSFIIRFWVDELPEGGAHPQWRGQITHVPSGERRYLQSFDEIRSFIVPYLQALGVELNTQSGKRRRRWWPLGDD